MAHRLSNRRTGTVITQQSATAFEATGASKEDAALFYVKRDAVRDTPWHGLGVAVDQCLTSADAIVAAGLDYEVAKVPLFDADGAQLTEKFLIKRLDRFGPASHLGVVGTKYTAFQNSTAFDIVDSIIGDGEAKFDTAGSLGNGEEVFLNAKLPDDMKIGGEKIDCYFLLRNTHDGSGRLMVYITPIRSVCQNTVNFAINAAKRSFGITHTVNYEQRLAEARKTLGMTREYYQTWEATANGLLAAKFTASQFEDLIKDLLPIKDDAPNATKTRIENARITLGRCYNADDLNNVRGTKWGAYNAVVDFADHNQNNRGSEATRAANAFLRTFALTTLKDDAFALILAK